jgi:hypothetical protein
MFLWHKDSFLPVPIKISWMPLAGLLMVLMIVHPPGVWNSTFSIACASSVHTPMLSATLSATRNALAVERVVQ